MVKMRYIDVMKDMYDRASTFVRTTTRETCEFSVTIGLHEGSTLKPYLFALPMD